MFWVSLTATPRGVEIGVIDGDEAERTGAAGLQLDIGDFRAARDRVADAQHVGELGLAARPHPARQRHRRQEAAPGRVAVGSDLGSPATTAGARHQCIVNGAASPVLGAPGSRNSVARRLCTMRAVTMSVVSSTLPIHVRR